MFARQICLLLIMMVAVTCQTPPADPLEVPNKVETAVDADEADDMTAVPVPPADHVEIPNTVKVEIEVHTDETYDMTIAHVPSFEFVYNLPEMVSTAELAERGAYRYMINGSFFHRYTRNEIVHVGWLSMDGWRPTVKNMTPNDHAQLAHIVQFDPENHSIKFIHEEQFEPLEQGGVIEFQTGPLVVENSEVTQTFIDNSINGLGNYQRTLIATVDQQDIYFIIVRKPTTLDQLGAHLLDLELFQTGRLDVINLDGGPSTLLYSTELPDLNYWAAGRDNADSAKLPFFLGVK